MWGFGKKGKSRGKKGCTKGKSCGATCIAREEWCEVDLGPKLAKAVGKGARFVQKLKDRVKGKIKRKLGMGRDAAPGAGGAAPAAAQPKAPASGSKPVTNATGNTKWARQDAQDFDNDFAKQKLRRVGDREFDKWKDSHGSGAQKLGEGAYGTVIRNKDGTVIKRGDISEQEAELIDRLGKLDLGPRMFAADIDGPGLEKGEGVNVRRGRIAMSEVPGKPMGDGAPDRLIGGKPASEIYWKAMADLHRQGIAHNDAHMDNLMVDSNGKGRWVDLGLAQASPKAALAEVLGMYNGLADPAFVKGATEEGNWQTRQWNSTAFPRYERITSVPKMEEFAKRFPVAYRVFSGEHRAERMLRKMGFSDEEISGMIYHGIRADPESYNRGQWGRMTDAQAMEVIKEIYDGI